MVRHDARVEHGDGHVALGPSLIPCVVESGAVEPVLVIRFAGVGYLRVRVVRGDRGQDGGVVGDQARSGARAFGGVDQMVDVVGLGALDALDRGGCGHGVVHALACGGGGFDDRRAVCCGEAAGFLHAEPLQAIGHGVGRVVGGKGARGIVGLCEHEHAVCFGFGCGGHLRLAGRIV